MTGRACWRGGMGDGGMGFISLLLALLGVNLGGSEGKASPCSPKSLPPGGIKGGTQHQGAAPGLVPRQTLLSFLCSSRIPYPGACISLKSLPNPIASLPSWG